MIIDNDTTSKYRCPVEYTLEVIGGKWKSLILWCLAQGEVKRYGEIKRNINGITHKMLSQQLKDLESQGLIHREQYNQVPPKVEYWLTEKGKTLVPILEAMCQWGSEYM
ncbi:winged helix-turn-helix transcriptional regulator [Sporanaerobacter acetigenes]|uniref:Transcriptional regulator, HxlR family n=1 Tax=Sporanaerobacter acetigenes DSM 13106 TaxID=1123281 RepID=A0A1M5VD16_9FIRM|nr:helix-turn-helix domain-containing protein [Sporanaerobacter acetigenes]SHH73081.1 transcriptional regulator, HxlR family [Sporanaerobacter acetigenes DSM 13106]